MLSRRVIGATGRLLDDAAFLPLVEQAAKPYILLYLNPGLSTETFRREPYRHRHEQVPLNPTQTKQARPRPPDPYRRPAGLGGPDDQDPLPHARLISIFRVRWWGQTPGCAKCMRNWTALKAFALVRGVRWVVCKTAPLSNHVARSRSRELPNDPDVVHRRMDVETLAAMQAGICASSLGCWKRRLPYRARRGLPSAAP